MTTVFSSNDEHDIILGDTDCFPIDWRRRLNGDTLTASTWTVPTGLTLGAVSFNSKSTQAFITADTVGTYCVKNQVDTLGSKTFNAIITITVLPACST